MPYDLKFDTELQVVRVSFYGEADLKEFMLSRADAGAMCQQHMCNQILVDMREMIASDGHLTLADCFEFSETFQKTDTSRLPPGAVVAGVLPSDRKAREKIEFMALASINRGAPVTPFDNYDEAVEWLLENGSKQLGADRKQDPDTTSGSTRRVR